MRFTKNVIFLLSDCQSITLQMQCSVTLPYYHLQQLFKILLKTTTDVTQIVDMLLKCFYTI